MRPAVTSDVDVSNRRTIATYVSYGDAQNTVDQLSDIGFPVEKTAIVAQDIRFVKEIIGRRGLMSIAFEGMLAGAGVGALVGFVLGLLSLFQPVVSAFVGAFWGLMLGGAAGLVLGLIGDAVSFGRRDFASLGTFHAGRFDVVADPDVARSAVEHLRDASRLVSLKR